MVLEGTDRFRYLIAIPPSTWLPWEEKELTPSGQVEFYVIRVLARFRVLRMFLFFGED